jgi:hypothetical protein
MTRKRCGWLAPWIGCSHWAARCSTSLAFERRRKVGKTGLFMRHARMIRLSRRNESPPVIVGQTRTSVARKTRSAFPPDSDAQRPNQFPVRWSDWKMLRGAYHDLRFVIGRVASQRLQYQKELFGKHGGKPRRPMGLRIASSRIDEN